MTSLSTLFGGGDTGSAAQDPLQEGYPVIAVYGGSFNDNWDVRLHRVHSGELVGSPWGAITNSTASYSHGMSNTHIFGYNSDYGSLNTGYSSHGYSSWPQYSMSMLQHDHYPYSWYGNCSKDGRLGFMSFHGDDHYRKYYRRINVISLSGRRPRRQFNLSNEYFSETQFNSSYGTKSIIRFDTNSNQYWGGNAPGSSTSYGSACYNQKTKTLAAYWANSSGSASGRIYMWRGTKDLMDETECPTVKDFFDNATVNYQAVNDATNWGYSTMNYNVNMVLGENDRVGINMRYDQYNYYSCFDCSATTNNNSAVSSSPSRRTNSNTTSYGPEQGMMYRARMQLTWDTEWAIMHSPYYYYGNGTSSYIVSTKDPRRMVYHNWTANDYGGILTPSGKSGFKIFTGQNTDGSPIRNWGIELGLTSHNPNETFYYHHGNQSYSVSEGSISNWNGTTNNSFSSYSFQYPGYYYSTSYPRYMTVNWWQTEGAYSQ